MKKSPFWAGVLDGMAARLLLFDRKPRRRVYHIDRVHPPTERVREVLASDWKRIGNDMRTVINRHYGIKANAKPDSVKGSGQA